MAADPEAATQDSTAAYIRGLAVQHRVSYVRPQSDVHAQRVTRPADDAIEPDEIECMLFALHRAGHLDLRELIHLQVEYLREAKL
jgi:hypothetical protein